MTLLRVILGLPVQWSILANSFPTEQGDPWVNPQERGFPSTSLVHFLSVLLVCSLHRRQSGSQVTSLAAMQATCAWSFRTSLKWRASLKATKLYVITLTYWLIPELLFLLFGFLLLHQLQYPIFCTLFLDVWPWKTM